MGGFSGYYFITPCYDYIVSYRARFYVSMHPIQPFAAQSWSVSIQKLPNIELSTIH